MSMVIALWKISKIFCLWNHVSEFLVRSRMDWLKDFWPIAQLRLTLWDPVDYSPLPGSSAHGIFQARRLEWVAISFSRGSFQPKAWTQVSCIVVSQFSHSVMSDSLQLHRLQHARPPCPSPTPGVYSNSYPSSQWYHSTTSFSVIPFFSCLQTCPASGYFPMSQFFTSGGQGIGVSASASVLPMNIQD